ncbi:hypothetical protein CQW23_13212 [Capsicum baccatum]|uniref:Uncharacterized protein n=1 Tax=Capsicum baccatum TaxID=33114 RepID=A0A2G2WUT0_CAPBA|nr:hypothetical protein CQW23_13212 [Capsicum baccatum]
MNVIVCLRDWIRAEIRNQGMEPEPSDELKLEEIMTSRENSAESSPMHGFAPFDFDYPMQVSSVVLREDIVNLLDFIERLKNEEDQIVLDTNQIEKLTFLSECLQLCYYISDGSNADMSCISYEVHDLVQSLFHQSGDDMLVKLKDHVVPRLLENIKSFIISDRQSESSATMTEDQLVELLDAVLVNLHYLPKVRAELFLPSMTQYELLLNVFGNLRDSHRLKVNGFVEHKEIEYALPQLQLMAESVGNFCFVLLSYQLDKTDETDEDGADEEDEDGLDDMLLKSSTFEDNSGFTGGYAHMFYNIGNFEVI